MIICKDDGIIFYLPSIYLKFEDEDLMCLKGKHVIYNGIEWIDRKNNIFRYKFSFVEPESTSEESECMSEEEEFESESDKLSFISQEYSPICKNCEIEDLEEENKMLKALNNLFARNIEGIYENYELSKKERVENPKAQA